MQACQTKGLSCWQHHSFFFSSRFLSVAGHCSFDFKFSSNTLVYSISFSGSVFFYALWAGERKKRDPGDEIGVVIQLKIKKQNDVPGEKCLPRRGRWSRTINIMSNLFSSGNIIILTVGVYWQLNFNLCTKPQELKLLQINQKNNLCSVIVNKLTSSRGIIMDYV